MKKKSVKVFSVILVSIIIVLLFSISLVSALSFSDVWKSIKNLFGFGEKEKELEGELKSLGARGSPDYGSPDYLKCTDSDVTSDFPDGRNYYKKGVCTDNNKQISDECIISRFSNNNLKESFCLNNICQFEYYDCSKEGKICESGICKNQTFERCYNDSDCLPVYGNKYCNNKSESCQSIENYQCVNNMCVSTGGGVACKNCSYGCADGECIQLSGTCTANESGNKRCYYFDKTHGGPSWWMQECIVRGANTMGAWTNKIECPYGCVDGACLPFNATISVATLKDNYEIGERIELTDPPDDEISEDKINNDKFIYERDKINQDTLLLEDTSILPEEAIKPKLPEHVPGEIIVKFKEDPEIKERNFFSQLILGKPRIETKFSSINRIHKKFKIEKSEKIFDKKLKRFENIRKLKLKEENLEEVIEEYKKDLNVEYAEPNYIAYTSFVPNDARYSEQWAHQNTQAELGWDIERGNSNVVIAIIDTGVDYTHEDLGTCINFSNDILLGYCEDEICDETSEDPLSCPEDCETSFEPGWPVEINKEQFMPVITNIDEDPEMEVLVYSMNLGWGDYSDKLFVFNHNGTIVPGFPKKMYGTFYGVPVVNDIDSDGKIEILLSNLFELHVFEDDGSYKMGFPRYINEPIDSKPAISDLNNDGQKEIIVGSGYFWGDYEGKIYVFDGNGEYTGRWPKSLGENYRVSTSSPKVGDINGDGENEIVHGAIQMFGKGKNSRVYAWNADGTFVKGFPVELQNNDLENIDELSEVVLADADNDGKEDIFVVSFQGKVYGIKGDGTFLPGWPKSFGELWSDLIFSDVDNDGNNELIFASYQGREIYAYNLDGNSVEGWPKMSPTGINIQSYGIGDVNNNGEEDIIVVSVGWTSYVYAMDQKSNIIEGWPKALFKRASGASPIIYDMDNDENAEIIVPGSDNPALHVYEQKREQSELQNLDLFSISSKKIFIEEGSDSRGFKVSENIRNVGSSKSLINNKIFSLSSSFTQEGSINEDCKIIGGYDFVEIDTQAYQNEGLELIGGEDYLDEDPNPMDYTGHGTHVAGIAAAKSNNGVGVSGVCPNCKIMALRAGFSINYPGYGEVGALEYDDIAQAIINATDSGADIISMSFGGPQDKLISSVIEYAYSKNVTLIAAAGNDNTDSKSYPSSYNNVIAVAATAMDDSKAYYSTFGYWVDVAAPGGDKYKDSMILSTVPKVGTISNPSGYKSIQGTSMATPYVAGVAGLILSKSQNLNPEDVKGILKQGVDNPNSDKYIGTGRVNVNKVLQINSLSNAIANISYPTNDEIISKNIDIIGTAIGDNYSVYYGSGIYPSQWIKIGNGTSVIAGVLANWDISNIIDGQYLIKLVVEDSNGIVEKNTFVKVGRGYHEGWPVIVEGSIEDPISVGDIDGDGTKEIILALGTKIYVWYHNGSLVNNWPQEIFREVRESPALGDLDNDGDMEIIVSARNSIYVFYGDGRIMWQKTGLSSSSMYEAAIADINADGMMEVVAGGATRNCINSGCKIYVWDKDGNILNTAWPKDIDFYLYSSPAVGDIDKDGSNEIVAVGPAWGSYNNPDLIWRVYVLNSDGSLLWEWEDPPYPNDEFISQYPSIADVNNDGDLEIIISGLHRDSNFFIKIFNSNGTIFNEFPVSWGSAWEPSAIANLDEDDDLEIILVGSLETAVWNIDGTLVEGWPKTRNNSESRGMASSASIGDINGDDNPDILVVTDEDSKIYAYHNDGTTVDGWPKNTIIPDSLPTELPRVTPILDDIDRDGFTNLILGKGNLIIVWDLETPYNPSTMEWPMFQHDPQHTGLYTKPKSDYQEGWDSKIHSKLRFQANDVLVDDLDNDNLDEVIVSTTGYTACDDGINCGRLYVFNYNGSVRNGFPVKVALTSLLSPVVGNVIGDSKKEIVINSRDGDHKIFLLDSEGNILASKNFDWWDSYNTPVLYDLDNDGYEEIIIDQGIFTWAAPANIKSKLHVLDENLNELNDWPKELLYQKSTSSPVVLDSNNDGILDIIISSWQSEGEVSEALNLTGDRLWTKFGGGARTIVTADVYGDSNPEIISAGFNGFDISDKMGNSISGWPKNNLYASYVIVSNMDNKDYPEIIASSSCIGNSNCNYIEIYYSNGSLVKGWPFYIGSTYPTTSITSYDVDSDGLPEIVYTMQNDASEYFLNALNFDGSIVAGFPKRIPSECANPARPVPGDLDNDGSLEILTGSCGLFVYSLEEIYNQSTLEWPMFQHDAQHTGCYDCDKQLLVRPQSKLVNNMVIDLTGNLKMSLQKDIGGVWQDVRVVVNKQVTIPANGLLKLDSEWNSQNVIASEVGNYRVYAKFEVDGESVEASWEFKVAT